MAKKSAKSKGYRRQTGKKPYLTKRDIAILCVLVAVVAVGAFFLFRYDDGALKVQNGAVVTEGDNWLIVNGSNVRGRARYFKLGEIGEIDGYTREAGTIATDANVPEYAFTPEDGDSGITSVTATTSHSVARALAEYGSATLAALEDTEVGEILSAELGGREVVYYLYTSAYTAEEDDAETAEEGDAGVAEADDTEVAEAGPNRFTKSVSGFIDAAHDSCVAIHVESSADSAEACLSDEALTAVLEQVAAAVTLEDGK